MSTEPTWTDDWLPADDARAIRAEDAERERNRTTPTPDRTAEIDSYVTEMVIKAEGLAIRVLVRMFVVLFAVAFIMFLVHALGTVIGLIIAFSLAGLAGYVYTDLKRGDI